MKNSLTFPKEGDRESVLTFNERDSKFMPRDKKETERKKKNLNMSKVRRLRFAWML